MKTVLAATLAALLSFVPYTTMVTTCEEDYSWNVSVALDHFVSCLGTLGTSYPAQLACASIQHYETRAAETAYAACVVERWLQIQ